MDEDKIKSILEFPTPLNVKQLQRIIGMTLWYRRFIPKFSEIMKPLHTLLKKGVEWKWNAKQEQALEKIKKLLTKGPILACPNFHHPFQLETDASDTGLGAVLTQNIDINNHVIALASRSLTEPERKYSTSEKECLAVVWEIRKFRPYSELQTFKLITDHIDLKWLHNLKKPTGRLARWALKLQEYDYEIIYRKGSLNYAPSALSTTGEKLDSVASTLSMAKEKEKEKSKKINDEWYNHKLMQVKKKPAENPNWRIRDNQLYFFRPDPLKSSLDLDSNPWKLTIPKELREQVLRENHDSKQAGHLGMEKTYARIAENYFWPGMYSETLKYVKECDTCQTIKPKINNQVGLLGKRIIDFIYEQTFINLN